MPGFNLWGVARTLSLTPIAYMYVKLLDRVDISYVFKPEFISELVSQPSFEHIVPLMYLAGLAMLIIAFMGKIGAVSFTSAVCLTLLVVKTSEMLGLNIAMVILSVLMYVLFDNFYTFTSGKKFKLSGHLSLQGLIYLLAFACMKYLVPVVMGIGFYYVMTFLLTYEPKVSYLELMLWRLVVETVMGKLTLLMVIMGVGIYLLKMYIAVVVEFTLSSRSRALEVFKRDYMSLVESVRKMSLPWITGWYALLSSLVFYPVVFIILRDLLDMYGLFTAIEEIVPLSIARLAVFIIIGILSWRMSKSLLLAETTSFRKLVLPSLLLAMMMLYLGVLKQEPDVVTGLLTGDPAPSSVDEDIFNEYYVWYNSMMRVVRYVSVIVGIAP